jgi:ABC-type glycerol-3-phosphate transport system substrate-binding protein
MLRGLIMFKRFRKGWIVLIVLLCFLPAYVFAAGEAEESAGMPELQYEYSQDMMDWAEQVKDQYGGTKLDFACLAHDTVNAMKELLPDFEKVTGIEVQLHTTDIAKQHDRVMLDFSTGKHQYDLIMSPEVLSPELWTLGYVIPIDPYVENKEDITTPAWFDLDDLLKAYRDLHTDAAGNLYGIPLSGEVGILMYREDVFEEYGFSVPKTTDELYEIAKAIDEMDLVIDNVPMSGVSFRGRPALGGANWLFQILIHSFGGTLVDPADDETPTVNTQAGVETIKYMTKLSKVGVPGIPSFNPHDAVNQYRNGAAAMVMEASVLAPPNEDPETAPLVAGKTGYAGMPAGPAGDYNASFAHAITISSETENPDAAWAFVTWMTSKGNQDKILDAGGAVVRESGLSDPANQAKYPYYDAILEGAKEAAALSNQGINANPKTDHVLQYINVWSVNVSQAMTGEISAEVAARRIQTQMTEIMQED